jgi:hypothetical protein
MNTVTIHRCPQELKRILDYARKDDVVLRTDSGAEFLLSEIDDFDYEIAAQRRNKQLMAYLDRARLRARKEKGIRLGEVFLHLGLSPAREHAEKKGHVQGSRQRWRTIKIPGRSRSILALLGQVGSKDLLVQVPGDREYALVQIKNSDRTEAKRRASDTVMKYLDGLSDEELPPMEVVFIRSKRPSLAIRKRTGRKKTGSRRTRKVAMAP